MFDLLFEKNMLTFYVVSFVLMLIMNGVNSLRIHSLKKRNHEMKEFVDALALHVGGIDNKLEHDIEGAIWHFDEIDTSITNIKLALAEKSDKRTKK